MFKPVDSNPDFKKLEEELLSFWEKEKIFEKSLEQTKDGEQFTFYDGPPFATGLPHYGHILASTIKDVIPRYQTMKGRYVRRRWGWDCHGLPIEELVEKELGISGKKDIEEKVGIKKFNETCKKFVLRYAEEWGKMVRRIARWTEFDDSYKTMDTDYMESVWWAFKETYNKKLVYEGRKVLLYCPRCETPISNFEVAMDNSYKTITDQSVIAKFQITNNQSQIPNDRPTYLLAWTTTPWTLPGNLALAVGSDIDYVVVKVEGENYILAKERAEKVFSDVKFEILSELKGSDLVGISYESLFEIEEMKSDQSYQIYSADFVTTEDGTGIVHTAVVYGEDDYKLGLEVELPVVPLLDEKGSFNEQAPEFIRGVRFKESEKLILKDIESRNLLFKREQYTHSYPHCWRCESPLIYNAIPAWFIDVQKIKSNLLKSNDKEVNWFPDHLKHGRYEKSVESAPDWNISRNRYWGNPIPVWKCEDCNKDTVVGSLAELKEKAVSGYEEGMDIHRPYIDEVVLKCDHCGKDARRITEIFDSWVEAGSMPFAEFHYPFENKEIFEARYPAQFVSEYIAQTRAWFYVMHVMNLIQFDKAPFENVLTSGNILAEDGTKMSKSKKNYPDPWEVIDKYGMDSLRFYLMNSVVMSAENMNFSEKDLSVVNRKVTRIIWNVLSYFVTYANEADWSHQRIEQSTETTVLNKWMNARTQELINQVTEHLDGYDTVRATRVIEQYVNDFSTWYVRRSRGKSDSNFFATFYFSLMNLASVIAPVMPYMAEKIYLTLKLEGPEEESVHLRSWPGIRKLEEDEQALLDQMQLLREIVVKVHALRAGSGIKLRQPLQSLEVVVEGDELSDELMEILKDEINVKDVIKGKEFKLNTNIDERLKMEGQAAELQRQINQFRKESGLKIGEMAELYYQTESDALRKAVTLLDIDKIYVTKLEEGEIQTDHKTEIEVDSEKIKLALKISK